MRFREQGRTDLFFAPMQTLRIAFEQGLTLFLDRRPDLMWAEFRAKIVLRNMGLEDQYRNEVALNANNLTCNRLLTQGRRFFRRDVDGGHMASVHSMTSASSNSLAACSQVIPRFYRDSIKKRLRTNNRIRTYARLKS